MDVLKQKNDLFAKVTSLLEKEFGSGDFVVWVMTEADPGKKSDSYYNYLKRFHFLFGHSEDTRLHLWNLFYQYGNDLNNLDRNDFSKEENTFLD